MEPRAAVREYYDALRAGEPLAPYFAGTETTVKYGISERLQGGGVADGLRAQTARTTDWVVESADPVVDRRGAVAWFADDVFMAWTDTEAGVRREFDTRWSGTLVEGEPTAEDAADRRTETKAGIAGGWRFVGMHVSTPGEL
jgi:hypothetical protein